MESPPVKSIIVLGGGSAGFLAALTLKQQVPRYEVRVVHSSKIPIIGVGEGSTFTMPAFLHGYLGIDPAEFHRDVKPTYKLGIKFLWGPRPYFNYTFTKQLDARIPDLPRANGAYCREHFDFADINSALMASDKAFLKDENGQPKLTGNVAYHLENKRFVQFLEKTVIERGIEIVDDEVNEVSTNETGVSELHLESGQSISGDLYIDCSGFHSALLGQALQEPYTSFESSLFCDRAIVGGWERTNETLKPYTTAETMNSGWSWQIEHDHLINRGYVYSSRFISEEEAVKEFRAKNPKIKTTRTIKFQSGVYERGWVKNVVALGNSSGFVEPLEATSLAMICEHAIRLVKTLRINQHRNLPESREEYNTVSRTTWENIRRFLALHYKFNTRLQTPFWKKCQEETNISTADKIVDFYLRHGPGGPLINDLDACRQHSQEGFEAMGDNDPFRWEGYLTMLVGQDVAHRGSDRPNEEEQKIWTEHTQLLKETADNGLGLKQTLDVVRSKHWEWPPHLYPRISPRPEAKKA